MDQKLILLGKAGLNIRTGIEYTGSEEKYLSAVTRYYSNYEKNSKLAREYYQNEDYENYKITVHALKSNSRMIGAQHLGEDFERLEKAALNSDTGIIRQYNDNTLDSYKRLTDAIGEVIGTEEAAIKQSGNTIDLVTAKQISDELLDALDDFDDELSKELLIKLSGYPFDADQKKKLDKAFEYIDDFMYDETADIIRELLRYL